MSMPISRRIVLKRLGTASLLTARIGAAEDEGTKIAGRAVEVSVTVAVHNKAVTLCIVVAVHAV
jgi:hypothetical protein